MSRPVPAQSLPPGIRFAALLATVVASLVWLKSGWELSHLLFAERAVVPAATSEAERALLLAAQAFAEESDRALGPMREARALILAAMSLTCGLVLTSALLLLRPVPFPRAGIRRMLSRMAIATALLRAADGAQSLALDRTLAGASRRLSEASLEFWARMAELSPPLSVEQRAELASRLVTLTTWGGLLVTVLVAGGLLALGQYFGSARVREAVALRDRFLEG